MSDATAARHIKVFKASSAAVALFRAIAARASGIP